MPGQPGAGRTEVPQGCACPEARPHAGNSHPTQLPPPKLSRAGGFLSFSYKQILNLKVGAENYPRHKNSPSHKVRAQLSAALPSPLPLERGHRSRGPRAAEV